MAKQKAVVIPDKNGEAVYWTVKYLRTLISTDKNAALKALRRVYLNQTASEQYSHSASSTNGVGFNKPDAPQLTRLAKELQVIGDLSATGTRIAQAEMPKYAKQIFRYMCERYPDNIVDIDND